MKSTLFITILLFCTVSYGQDINIDSRLKDNLGDRIESIYHKQNSYYNFLKWELDYGYQIIDLKPGESHTLLSISEIVSNNNVKFSSSDLENKNNFNFFKYNFIRQKNESVYYDLGNGKILKFTSLTAVWDEYKKSKK